MFYKIDQKPTIRIHSGMPLFTLFGILVIQNILYAGNVFSADNMQVVSGAGPPTKVVSLFIDLLAKTNAGKAYRFIVHQHSIKHIGGIRSTQKYIFGRTDRPLSEIEKAKGFEELFLAKMPIVFVAGRTVV